MIKSSTLTEMDEMESRRQAALLIAAECQAIIEKNFLVKEVILFGSLTGDGPWHDRSDIDLAVVGMSDRDWWDAYGKLEKIMPSWLTFDLVRLENTYPEMRSRILREKIMPTNKYLALKERLELELTALERDYQAFQTAWEASQSLPQYFVIRTFASSLTDFYKRYERISERVAVTLDGGLPKGDNWHELLLQQVASTGANQRPPLWSSSLLKQLDEYRKFRHVVHHKYGDELKPENVMALVELAPSVKLQVEEEVTTFNRWLEEQAKLDV